MKQYKLEIKKSKIHGLGVFAKEKIPWGVQILEYTGERISRKESDRRSKFYEKIDVNCLFELNDKYDLDGLVGGNESRLINHSKNPNVCCIRDEKMNKIYFYSYDDIEKGQELLFDYGDGFTFKKEKK